MHDEIVHVAAGVIYDQARKRVLVSKRHENTHMGGLWEFPGGKLEDGEDARAALERELFEEIGLVIDRARPLIKIRHDYPEKSVLLDAWIIDEWHGPVHNKEKQIIEWIDITELNERAFPGADRAIITATQLPVFYQISPDPFSDIEAFLDRTETCLMAGMRLFQLRCRDTSTDDYPVLVRRLRKLFESYDATLLINASPAEAVALDAHGVHLTSDRLLQLQERPLGTDYLVAASCHDAKELEHAARMDIDFVVLAPVNRTPSHPGRKPIGWEQFRDLVEMARMPVYALGGLRVSDMETAVSAGAQGVAMISEIWDADDPAGLLCKCLSY